MFTYFNKLCSTDNGYPSSSRFISMYLTIWGTLYLTICTFTNIEPVVDGNGIAMLLMASYGSTAVKKPFEDRKYDKKPFKLSD